MIDPASINANEEKVLVQGEEAIPSNVRRLTSASPLYPHR